MKKCLSLFLALLLLLALALPAAADGPAPITTTCEAANISKYGNIRLALTCDEIKAAGYAYGDVVTVAYLDRSMDLPFCNYYSDVDSGSPAIFALDTETQVYLSVNMGDFATSNGLAEKTVNADGTYRWSWREGISDPLTVTISMKEPGGYYDEYLLHQLSYSYERADYPQLNDEQFANFRAVETRGMGRNILYRTASPVNTERGRSTYADAAIRAAGVTVVMNLADDPTGIKTLGGYEGSYYATTDYIALNTDMDFTSAAFRSQLAEGLRFFAANPGVYAVHCLEGKDRAGYVTALLECLMGATYDEVVADYMTTYYNYYGVTADDLRYASIAGSNIVKSLRTAFDVADLERADLAVEAAEYMHSIGLNDAELAALKTNLSVSRPFTDVAPDAWYADAVKYVSENALMNGTGAGRFSPDARLTRAQLVTVLWRRAGQPVVNFILPFSDVPADAWYAEAVRWAASERYVDGGTEQFRPDDAITGEETAELLRRYCGSADLMPETDGTLTRAQAAVMLMNLDAADRTGLAAETAAPTGIIGAMEEELAALKSVMTVNSTRTVAGMEFCEGTLDGKAVVVVQCGMGKVNAGLCAHTLINDFGCARVINTGVAGSLDAEIDIGDIVVSTDAVQHDFTVEAIGFAKGEIPYTGLYAFPADETLRALAVSAARAVAPEVRVFEGRVCTGDQFISSREQRETILANFGGECCEMEGGAIAQTCYLNGTPFVIIRAISDKADDSEEMSYEVFKVAAAARCAAIVRYMVAAL